MDLNSTRFPSVGGVLAIFVAVIVMAATLTAQRSYGPGVCGPLDPLYIRTATETGGQPFPMAPAEIEKAGIIMSESSRSDATMILWAGGTAADAEGGFVVPIDGSVKRVTFSMTFDGKGGRAEIAAPDGALIQPGAVAGDTILNCGRILSIDAPVPGAWRVKPTPTDRFWVVVHGRSERDVLSAEFVRAGGRPGHEGLFPIHGMPIAGRASILRVRLSEPEPRTPDFQLISSQGNVLRTVALDRVNAEEFAGAGRDSKRIQTAKIVVNDQGYEPAKVTLDAGVRARLTFVRTTDKTCGTEVVFPSLNIKRALPLNEPVTIEFTPGKTGEIAFACGMDMLRGTVIVQ